MMDMRMFRKLYYKLTTLACLIAMFGFLFNMDKAGIGYGCLYILIGLLSFGTLSIGKEEFDTEKPIRNILLFLAWSLLGFGITAVGIATLIDKSNGAFFTLFLIFGAFGFSVVYLISIIKNKDLYAILSVALFVIGLIIGANSNGVFVLGLLTMLMMLAAIVAFVYSIIKGITED